MKWLAIAAIVGFVVLLLIVVIVAVVINMIKNAAKKVADRAIGGALGIGAGIANKAAGKVIDIGGEQLSQGIESAKEVIGQEMLRSDPRRMATEATKLAKKNGGELTFSRLMAEMSISKDLAHQTLDRLLKAKVCIKHERDGESVYIFPAFKKKVKIKYCEYCDATYRNINEIGDNCPSCGAGLKVRSTYD